MVSKKEGELLGQIITGIIILIVLFPVILNPILTPVVIVFIPVLIILIISKVIQLQKISPYGVFGSPPQDFQEYQDFFDRIDWMEFEDFVGHLFNALGYKHVEVTSRGGDRGVDVTGKNPQTGELFAAECKKYTSNPVGEPKIRNFVSAADYTFGAKEKWFFTTSHYAPLALDFAKKANVTLVGMEDYKGNIQEGTIGLIDLCIRTLSDKTVSDDSIGTCTQCNGTLFLESPLKEVSLKPGRLICTRYPVCKVSISLPMDGWIKITEVNCPTCNRKLFQHRGIDDNGTLKRKRYFCIQCGTISNNEV